MIKSIAKQIRLMLFKIKFRNQNKHNHVIPQSVFHLNNVTIGKDTYGPLNVLWLAPSSAKIKIGNYCSIGPEVKFLVGGEHDYRRISTYPFQSKIYKQKTEMEDNYNIIIEDDVWIGYDSLIMSGVRIGKGSVVGARSIVTKDIPPYSIYVGNHVIKKRFSDDILRKIREIDYSLISHIPGDDYEKYCQVRLTEDNVDKILQSFVKCEEITH
ncbi:MAG: CatB-related O-acetyltransferase [Erysipelotrichaceae bacterium]